MAVHLSLLPCSSTCTCTSSSESDYCCSEFAIVEETEEGRIENTCWLLGLFWTTVPESKPTQKMFRCKLCRKLHKVYSSHTRNLLKHLQPSIQKSSMITKKNKQSSYPRCLKVSAHTIQMEQQQLPPREPFKNQDKALCEWLLTSLREQFDHLLSSELQCTCMSSFYNTWSLHKVIIYSFW